MPRDHRSRTPNRCVYNQGRPRVAGNDVRYEEARKDPRPESESESKEESEHVQTSMTLLVQTSSLENCEIINFYCFSQLHLWSFVAASQGN